MGKTSTLPGPRGLPWLGNARELGLSPLAFLSRIARKHGDFVAFRMGSQQAVMISDPGSIARVLRDRRFQRSEATRSGLATLLGPGLMTLEGTAHLRHRRLMQPAFHRERLQRYVDIMADETYRTLQTWRDGERRDLRSEMARLTLTIVARALLDARITRDLDRFDRALKRAQPAVLLTALLANLTPVRAPVPAPFARASFASLHRTVREIVNARRAEQVDRGDLLLASRDEAGALLTDEEVCSEVLTILLAGHDTTAQTLSWACYLLAQHPNIMRALTAEVHEVAGARPLTPEDLPRLDLADRVVRETMRLYPAAWWTDRIASEPVELGGQRIPAGCLVVFSTFVTHRDPRNFPDPLRFDPDRFLPAQAAQIPDGSYFPFGAGMHACIGSGFAQLEARLLLAALAQRFSIALVSRRPISPRAQITPQMREPLHVVLRSHGPTAAERSCR